MANLFFYFVIKFYVISSLVAGSIITYVDKLLHSQWLVFFFLSRSCLMLDFVQVSNWMELKHVVIQLPLHKHLQSAFFVESGACCNTWRNMPSTHIQISFIKWQLTNLIFLLLQFVKGNIHRHFPVTLLSVKMYSEIPAGTSLLIFHTVNRGECGTNIFGQPGFILDSGYSLLA